MRKIKKYKWGKYLPHIIIEKPSEVKFDDFNYDVERADDHYFINNEDYYSGNFYLYLGIGAFILSSIGFTFENSKEDKIVFTIFFFLLGCFFIIYHYTKPKKKVILDRMNGVVTFPGFLYSKPYTMSFENIVAGLGKIGTNGGVRLTFFHYNGITGTEINIGSYEIPKAWSFIVWYMDKNRPLPPGEAFDPYRKKDFQRRKAEGFPPPLYPSYIDTPEDSESQKELSQLHREEKQKRLEKKRRKRKDK